MKPTLLTDKALIEETRHLARLMMQDDPVSDDIDYMSVGVRLAQLTLEIERREKTTVGPAHGFQR